MTVVSIKVCFEREVATKVTDKKTKKTKTRKKTPLWDEYWDVHVL